MKSDDVIKRDLFTEFGRPVLIGVTATTRSELHFCDLACITLGVLGKMCEIMIRRNLADFLLMLSRRGCCRLGFCRSGGRGLRLAIGGRSRGRRLLFARRR